MSFIWINNPSLQKSYCTLFAENKNDFPYAIVGFRKKSEFDREVKSAEIKIFADTKYFLYVNGIFTGVGPVCPGGDWGTDTPVPVQYYSTYEIDNPEELDFYVQVQHLPDVQTDISQGKSGLWIEYRVHYATGESETFSTDESWECRLEGKYIDMYNVDFNIPDDKWEKAVETENIWRIKKSLIYNLDEENVYPVSLAEETNILVADFDRIYSAYFVIETNIDCSVEIETMETLTKKGNSYYLNLKKNTPFRALRLASIGHLNIHGITKEDIKDVHIVFTHYPVKKEGYFKCSDELLNKIFEVGKHTTKICRQTIELDSPYHQENLGCTGDYFIESLIAYYCFGDTSLSYFDILRTAEYMRMTKGKMFHTSYSLIWVEMVWDNYMFSGNKAVLSEVVDVLDILLERFDGYIGESGTLDNATDYLFIDWIPVGKYNLHHPPKALGQATLTAFYYNALNVASKIYAELGENGKSRSCTEKAVNIKAAFNRAFYDEEKCVYFAGLNIPDPGDRWRPENTDKKYYTKHANILAALYGLTDEPTELMERILNDETLIGTQPYFMHFEFEAIYKCGLFDKYGIKRMYLWEEPIKECSKAMKEAWGEYEGYNYDYSHAWGATPTYQLMSKLSGLEIIEPGFKRIKINPNSFGLEFFEISIPTPYGYIYISSDKTKIPEEIIVL